MLVAIISDIHANAEALRYVVKDARLFHPNIHFWCLGDVFGRGPMPGDVWDILSLDIKPQVWLAGNWDWGLIERISNVDVDGYSDGDFKPIWWRSLQRQAFLLKNARVDYDEIQKKIKELPQIVSPYPGIYLAHGSFNLDITKDLQMDCVRNYLFPEQTIEIESSVQRLKNFIAQPIKNKVGGFINKHGQWSPPRLLAIGHTHVRAITWLSAGKVWSESHVKNDDWYDIPDESCALVNPGSVGFPRTKGENGCANYAILHIHKQKWQICFRDVWFDHNVVISGVENYYPLEIAQAIKQGMNSQCSCNDPEKLVNQFLLSREAS